VLIEPRNAVANCSIGVLPIFYLLDQSQHGPELLHSGFRAGRAPSVRAISMPLKRVADSSASIWSKRRRQVVWPREVCQHETMALVPTRLAFRIGDQ
jgi:hypothetical protein